MPAAFEGSSFIITYPQSDFALDGVHVFLKSLPHVQYVLSCSEKHADGGWHRHCVVHFSARQRLAARAFDYEGRHPNVKAVGRRKDDWERVCAYVRKDGEFLEWGTPRHAANVWSAIATAGSRQEAQDLLLRERPRDAVLNARNFDYWLDKMFPVQALASFTPRPAESFVLPDSLLEWQLENFMYVY